MEKDECERALKKEVFENKLEEFKDQTLTFGSKVIYTHGV